jgi:CHAT domain
MDSLLISRLDNTSRGEESRLLDESINLVSAIQLAGYPSVVGTLWEESGRIAQGVYSWMVRDGRKFRFESAAEGLHRAVRELREETRRTPARLGNTCQNDPMKWAPYLHVGI